MQHNKSLAAPDASDELSQLTKAATRLGRETVDVSGFLNALDARCHSQLDGLDGILTDTSQLSDVSARMLDAAQRMAANADQTIDRVRSSLTVIKETGQTSQNLAEWVNWVNAQGPSVEDMLNAVQASNTVISDIASQVHILAINAKIEAARAGQAGKGFSIVADSVSDLSHKTAGAADTITQTVERLVDWMGRLQKGAYDTSRKAEQVLTQSGETDDALSDIENRVEDLRTDAHSLSSESGQADAAVKNTMSAVQGISESVRDVTNGVDQASKRCESLIDTSEGILQNAVAIGGNGEDSAMILLVQDLSGQISTLFSQAVDSGKLTLSQMFDETYKPIPDSDPQQVTTAFTKLTDTLLPDIQEPVLSQDKRIVFCAAVDRNGYLPTHNLKFAQTPSDDPVWNAANCRNRRIFDDRVGLKAGQNQKPFLLQVYRRDMGGGTFTMMKDLSAPITIQGRHWGGLRLAYKI